MTRHVPLLIVAGPARSGIAALAGALAAALGWPLREASAGLARIALVAEAARRQATRCAALGLPPPAPLLTPAMAEALLAGLLEGAQAGLVLQAAETLPDPAVLPGLGHVLPLLPQAKLVLLRRDAADTVASRLRALPPMPFVTHCLAWAQAMEAAQALLDAAPAQAQAVTQEAMLEQPEAVVERLSGFCGLEAEAARRALRHLREEWPNRTGLAPAARRSCLSEMGWSTPEKVLFLEVCGPAMRQAGQPVDNLAAALRREVLHLGEVAQTGGLRVAGLLVSLPPEGGENGMRLEVAVREGRAIAVFPAVAPAGRTHLTLRLQGLAANGAGCRVRVELVGTLSRELLLAEEAALPAGGQMEIRRRFARLPAMIDLVISLPPGHEEGWGLDVQEATFAA